MNTKSIPTQTLSLAGNRKDTVQRAFAAVLFLALLACAPGVRGQTTATVSTLYSFGALPELSQPINVDGADVIAGVIRGSDGNFYGTTIEGGSFGAGIAFQLTPAGILTPLYSFETGLDGTPIASLTQGSDGNIYGTAGPFFKITPGDGTLTLLHTFAGGSEGDDVQSHLIQGGDGNFYGVATEGGTHGEGTVFQITPTGVVTLLHTFDGSDGGIPTAGLVQGSDGYFYGTTSSGGANGAGTFFRITPAGELTTLYNFVPADKTNGSNPVTGLVQGSDGNFYGTTSQGGANGRGTIFQITPAGILTPLYGFSADGGGQYTSLVQGSDGNFYGTAENGGANGMGMIFQLAPAGVLTTLYSFSGSDGAFPAGILIQGSDGSFYGTTYYGGVNGTGTVYKMVVTTVPTPTPTPTPVPTPTPAPVLPTVTIVVAGTGEAIRGSAVGKAFVQRTGDTSTALTVLYKVAGDAKPGVDYKLMSGVVIIPAGASQAKIKIKSIDDGGTHGKRVAKIKLKPSDGSKYTLGSSTVVEIKVIDPQ